MILISLLIVCVCVCSIFIVAFRTNGTNGEHKNEVQIVSFNPEIDSRSWGDVDRLQYVRVDYRRVGTNEWTYCLNASNLPLFLSINEVLYVNYDKRKSMRCIEDRCRDSLPHAHVL